MIGRLPVLAVKLAFAVNVDVAPRLGVLGLPQEDE